MRAIKLVHFYPARADVREIFHDGADRQGNGAAIRQGAAV